VKNSKIEWTDATWNPVTGCDSISAGCRHCYARLMARRLRAMGSPRYARGFELTTHPEIIDEPMRWTKPRHIFVCSMSDLFHESLGSRVIKRIFQTMNSADRHTFQVLTKRSGRLAELAPALTWSRNIWAGVTVESAEYTKRIQDLRAVPAAVRFVSFEPLIGPIPRDIDLIGIDWAIVGGESGPQARPINYRWVLDICDACKRQGVAFFFKQWGGRNRKRTGRLLQGRTWNEMPGDLGRTSG
jgi:protein gp37